jgi:MOSC domain-containing protein YiiM
MKNSTFQLKSINTGTVETLSFKDKSFPSAVKKRPIQETQFINEMGFLADEQAYEGHGGVDKALCAYPYDHYEYWRDRLHNFSETALFGENLTIIGLTEDKACVGDVYAFGETRIQITEPRTPCYKLAAKYDVPDLAAKMSDTGYTGFMFRVLKEGNVSPDDELTLIEQHPKQVTISFINHVKFVDRFNKEKLEKVLAVDEISEALRSTLMKQYERKNGPKQ